MTKSLDVDPDVSTAYCKSSSGDGVDWFPHSIMYHGGLLQLFVLFPCTMVSSGVLWFAVRRRLWCFLIIGIHASGISAPLSLFMLFGLQARWRVAIDNKNCG